MKKSLIVTEVLENAERNADLSGVEYLTPEHVILEATKTAVFKKAATLTHLNFEPIKLAIEKYLGSLGKADKTTKSYYYKFALKIAEEIAVSRGTTEIGLAELLLAYATVGIDAVLFIEKTGTRVTDFIEAIASCEHISANGEELEMPNVLNKQQSNIVNNECSSLLKDLCAIVAEKPEPLIGREPEILRTIEILGRAKKNNPIHIGEPGVGKTAIAKGLASKINEGLVPDRLKNARIFSLDLSSLISGTKYRGEFEQRLKNVLESLKEVENPILYIDEIHNIVGLGAGSESSFDGANILKDYLTDGKIKFIGATTHEEYKKYFQKDKALNRRFQPVDVKEPSIEESIQILKGLKSYYETFHGVTYTTEAIEAAVTLSKKYIQDRFLPDKAIDLIDEAGAKISMSNTKKTKRITKKHIQKIIATLCKIPEENMQSNEASKLAKLGENIKKRVFGQDKAVDLLVDSIKLSRAGLLADKKPVISALFVGPTGVGKTEVARSLADELGIPLIKFDMSEYAEEHTISKLIGAPAGYVGYEEGGLLVEKIRQNPHCVLLLDEIEKAHPKIFNVLLQVLDDAQLTDNQGRKADFRNVSIIMTSNAGAAEVGKRMIGFGNHTVTDSNISETVSKTFSPEFRNRLTDIVVFNPMDEDMGRLVVKKELGILTTMLKNKNVELDYSDEAVDFILNKGLSVEYGARQIQRVVAGEIKKLFVNEILFGKLSKGGKCKLIIKENEPELEIA